MQVKQYVTIDLINKILLFLNCNCVACDSEDGENCIDSVTTVPPAPLVSPGGISAIVIVVIVVIAVLSKLFLENARYHNLDYIQVPK